MRRFLASLFVAGALVGQAADAGAQETSARFEIASAGDSTFTLVVGRHPWVRPGLYGIVVDPRQRDVLIARFQIIAADSANAMGLVTGMTTRVTTEHVALLDKPPPPELPWHRRRSFWIGVLVGIAAGFGAGAAAR
ncbi:MAG: hypothetical protein ACT4PJ_05465 [Gemmatimonadaceae bacterium]